MWGLIKYLTGEGGSISPITQRYWKLTGFLPLGWNGMRLPSGFLSEIPLASWLFDGVGDGPVSAKNQHFFHSSSNKSLPDYFHLQPLQDSPCNEGKAHMNCSNLNVLQDACNLWLTRWRLLWHPLHRFLPLALILVSPWVILELFVGMELARSLLGREERCARKGLWGQFGFMFWSRLNSELVKSNYIYIWGLDPC